MSVPGPGLTLPGLLLALGCLGACRGAGPAGRPEAHGKALADGTARPRPEPPRVSNATFAYLLARYDGDGDQVLTALEYTRHDGQFARWDRDGDGALTRADWSEGGLQVNPQIRELQRRRVLGRYFQDDDDRAVLTIDELAEAFLRHFDGVTGSPPDEELSEEEFRAAAPGRACALPGDGSMQMQSYSGGMDPWSVLTSLHDRDRNGKVALAELCAVFEEDDVYELRFDREHADAGAVEGLDYEVGLPTGTPVPDLRLTVLHDDVTVSLRDLVGRKPVALVFGSYT